MTTNGAPPILSLKGVNTHYGAAHILKDVDIDIHAGEMVCSARGQRIGEDHDS